MHGTLSTHIIIFGDGGREPELWEGARVGGESRRGGRELDWGEGAGVGGECLPVSGKRGPGVVGQRARVGRGCTREHRGLGAGKDLKQ